MFSSSIELARTLPGNKFVVVPSYRQYGIPYVYLWYLRKEGIHVWSKAEKDWWIRASGIIIQQAILVDCYLTTQEYQFIMSRMRDIGELKANYELHYISGRKELYNNEKL